MENNLVQKTLSEEEIISLYENHLKFDFPSNELKKINHILNLLENKLYLCNGYFKNNNLKSYMCFATAEKNSKICLLDFFAVNRNSRNLGFGSKTIHLLKNEKNFFENGIIAEIENPESAKTEEEKIIRKKRENFYIQNGFIKTTIKSNCFGVDFLIIYLPKENILNTDQIEKELINIYKSIFSKTDFENNIKVWR